MTDITRNDLVHIVETTGGVVWQSVSDEEFDRIARQERFIPIDELMTRHIDLLSYADDQTKQRLLRALLTEPCETCRGASWCNRHDSQYINDGYCDRVLQEEGVTPENMQEEACQGESHLGCGRRLRDGVVRRHDPTTWKVTFSIPGDLVEGSDDE